MWRTVRIAGVLAIRVMRQYSVAVERNDFEVVLRIRRRDGKLMITSPPGGKRLIGLFKRKGNRKGLSE